MLGIVTSSNADLSHRPVNLSSYIVGAIINRPPNYLLANNWISEGNHILSPIGDGILFHKIPGRIISAPTDSNEHRIDKLEFEDETIPSIDYSIITAPGTNCQPGHPGLVG